MSFDCSVRRVPLLLALVSAAFTAVVITKMLADSAVTEATLKEQQKTAAVQCSIPSLLGAKQLAKIDSGEYPGSQFGSHMVCHVCDAELATHLVRSRMPTVEAIAVGEPTPYMQWGPENRKSLYAQFLYPDGSSCKYGNGIEIGALHDPSPVGPCGQGMIYVDQTDAEELARLYPELDMLHIKDASLIDDGNLLAKVKSGSRGFLVASHVIEHVPHVLLAVENWLRVLKVGGIAIIMAPYKCISFDACRLVTDWDHFSRDYVNAREQHDNTQHMDDIWKQHLPEWALSDLQSRHKCDCGSPACWDLYSGTLAAFDAALNPGEEDFKKRGGMHFHTWTLQSWVNFWVQLESKFAETMPFKVKAIGFEPTRLDMPVVLEKL